ncbi:MAG: hypothetical protein GYA51_13850 [Candidatus Methanofastidiosa archaeon]|nr:hypothetical protein [Candidatus Methanofastidiosa archaeon]
MVLVSFVAFGAGLLSGKKIYSGNQNKMQIPLVQTPKIEPITYSVYITGAVKNPDVYKVEEGSIVKDLLQIAGGPTEDADLLSCNLAYKVHDGEKIVIPSKASVQLSENGGMTPENTEYSETNGKININKANLEQLMALPGIGEVKAQAIIDYRTKNGPFKSIQEIMNVTGIGEKTFEKIQDMITVF